MNEFNNPKISKWYFKQTIILFSVSFLLFSLTTIFDFGIIGIVVFIRAIFMLNTEYKGFKKYKVITSDDIIEIIRGTEKIILNRSNISKIEKNDNKLGFSDYLFYHNKDIIEVKFIKLSDT